MSTVSPLWAVVQIYNICCTGVWDRSVSGHAEVAGDPGWGCRSSAAAGIRGTWLAVLGRREEPCSRIPVYTPLEWLLLATNVSLQLWNV